MHFNGLINTRIVKLGNGPIIKPVGYSFLGRDIIKCSYILEDAKVRSRNSDQYNFHTKIFFDDTLQLSSRFR